MARQEYEDDYNCDLLEGMEPMVFVPGGNLSRSDRRDEYMTYLYDGNDARVPDDDSIVDRERRTWREYCASIFRKGLAPFPSSCMVLGELGRFKLQYNVDIRMLTYWYKNCMWHIYKVGSYFLHFIGHGTDGLCSRWKSV